MQKRLMHISSDGFPSLWDDISSHLNLLPLMVAVYTCFWKPIAAETILDVSAIVIAHAIDILKRQGYRKVLDTL